MLNEGGGKLTLRGYNSITLAVLVNLTSVYIVHPVETNDLLATTSAPAESPLDSWCLFEFVDARIANFIHAGTEGSAQDASKENAAKGHRRHR